MLNCAVAEQCLLNLKRKFKRDPNYEKEYRECLNNDIHKCYTEMVPPAQVKGTEGHIPHHGGIAPKEGPSE